VALVKPMFELGRGVLPTTADELDEAVGRATVAVGGAGWTDVSAIRSAMLGSRGAVEFFVHARRS
jgi:predicted rRNA methylase YqxC with S4 and FtsJ domains